MNTQEFLSETPCHILGCELVSDTSIDNTVAKLPRLSDVDKGGWAEELHPSMAGIDDIQHEFIYHWKLLTQTWSVLHFRALIVGCLAFIIGGFSPELLDGGDPYVSGLEGIRSVDGIAFFQLILSLALWGWFIAQLWNLFPIMKGHSMNLLSAWLAAMVSMILFHVATPAFPLEFSIGDMLGGIVGIVVMGFLAFIVGRAVVETRDEHVQVRHFSEDEREMAKQISEHSLTAWAISLGVWLVLLIFNTWCGVHFVANRLADSESLLVLHLITGPLLVAGLMHILWFPQLMLGVENTRVLSKRARITRSGKESEKSDSSATYESEIEIESVESNGKCPECKTDVPIYRHSNGNACAPCPKENCEGSGPANSNCEMCKTAISSRWSCTGCGVNAPLVDYLPDGDAW